MHAFKTFSLFWSLGTCLSSFLFFFKSVLLAFFKLFFMCIIDTMVKKSTAVSALINAQLTGNNYFLNQMARRTVDNTPSS